MKNYRALLIIGYGLELCGFFGMYVVGKEAVNHYVRGFGVAWPTLSFLFALAAGVVATGLGLLMIRERMQNARHAT